MALFSNNNSNEDSIREELLKKSMEISQNAREVTEEDIKNQKNNLEDSTHTFKYLAENGIDAQSAVDILGDEETFNERLKEFATIAKSKYGKLMDCKVAMNLKDYANESRELKNIANYLGIDDLFIMSKMHEKKAMANDATYIVEHFKEYEDEIMTKINVVNDYFKESMV